MNRCIKLAPPTIKYLRIMLLGEAPGEKEEAKGEPFIGRAGQRLDSLLVQAELPRAGCVVTNVFHIRPKDNEILTFFTEERDKSDPKLIAYPYKKKFYVRPEYGPEIGRLFDEIKLWRPKVIIALGATALWAMTGRDAISMNFGHPISVESYIVMPVFHPSFLLRSGATYDSMMIDALKAAKELAGFSEKQ